MASGWRRVLASRWFKLALSALLLGVLFYETNLGEMRAAMSSADPLWMLAALAGSIFSQALSAYRWWLLARAVGFQQPFSTVLSYYFSGMYLNLFGPGTVTGDIGRTLYLASGQRRGLALTTVVAHRLTGFVTLAWMGAIAVIVIPHHPLPAIARWLAALLLPTSVVAALYGPRLAARLLPTTNNWRHMIEHDLAPYWHDRRLLVQTLTLATLTHLLQMLCQAFVALALGLHLPLAFFFVVMPLVNTGGTLPFSMSGVGVREAGYWYFLSQDGVAREPAIALGLLTSLVVLVTAATGLPFFLHARQAPGDGQASTAQP
ncbi:MAG: lysylphosphatidylglycerol synthase transmembrane domain-containing protein [Candidatus Binatia bacterium]